MPVKAEIVSVGTELLLGHMVNTDAAIVARELAALGFDLTNTQVVGDNPARLRAALELALSRADVIVTTGGLGPTQDDLTKETVASLAGLPLEENAECAGRLRVWFGDRAMSSNQRKQAFFPKGSIILQNHAGTAPGCIIPMPQNRFVILLPGPPHELTPMLEREARPFLQSLSQASIHSTIIRTFGIGEGAAAALLGELLSGANPTAATYASDAEMFVKVTAKAESAEKAALLAAPLVAAIRERLGDVAYGIDVASLESVVVSRLVATGKTIATAESCTGGLLAKRITDQPGASAIFGLGLVTYANKAKEKLLAVPAALIEAHGAVSREVASAMAENVRKLNGADYGIGISGIAGPDGGTAEKPVGLVYIALATDLATEVRVMRPFGISPARSWVRQRAASHALDMVRRHLAGLPVVVDAF